MINLFEYQNKIHFPYPFEELEVFLDEIWKTREKNPFYQDIESEKDEGQRFLQFLHNSKEIKSNKYVGIIQFKGKKINLLPKIFFDQNREYTPKEIFLIHHHILWWLSYCRKIKFPNYLTSLGETKADFFEVLIYLFSKYTKELLSTTLYRQYEEINRELPYIKGRLNSNAYISENLCRGRWQKLNCTYDFFTFDNVFNRTIKYVATLLYNVSSSQENKKNLQEILFILDEVSDEKITAEQCSRIYFNPLFAEYETVKDYCLLFLSNSISYDYKNDLKLFAFLLPMEYVFEDFIFGFIEKEIKSVEVKAQKSNTYLDEAKTFNLRPDLLLEIYGKSLIADTKYKIVYSDVNDPHKGISQQDLYQMLAYAIRFNVDEIILFYPNTIKDIHSHSTELVVRDKLADEKEIVIKAHQLPILYNDLLNQSSESGKDLNSLFKPAREKLKKRLEEILPGKDNSLPNPIGRAN